MYISTLPPIHSSLSPIITPSLVHILSPTHTLSPHIYPSLLHLSLHISLTLLSTHMSNIVSPHSSPIHHNFLSPSPLSPSLPLSPLLSTTLYSSLLTLLTTYTATSRLPRLWTPMKTSANTLRVLICQCWRMAWTDRIKWRTGEGRGGIDRNLYPGLVASLSRVYGGLSRVSCNLIQGALYMPIVRMFYYPMKYLLIHYLTKTILFKL